MTCGADVSTVISRAAFSMTSCTAFIADDVRTSVQIEAVKVDPPIELPPPGG